jgi:hypothetical protein
MSAKKLGLKEMTNSEDTTYAYAKHSWLLSEGSGYTASGLIHAFLDYCHHISIEPQKDTERAGEKLLVFNCPSKQNLRWRLLICGEDTGLNYAEIDLPVFWDMQLEQGPFELLAAHLRIALNGWEQTSRVEKEAFLTLVDKLWQHLPGDEVDDR